MKIALPIAVDDILLAITNTACTDCHGLGRWRTKIRCRTCNGKGSTNEVAEICKVCNAQGQLPNRPGPPVDCALCDGFGIFYPDCWECRASGFVYEKDDYCGKCNGEGEIVFAQKVVAMGNVLYVRHLVRKLGEYTDRGTPDDLERACALDELLLDIIKHAHSVAPPRHMELFPEADRVQYGSARMILHRAVRQHEDRTRDELKEMRVAFAETTRRIRSKTRKIQDDLQGRFWLGVGHDWDRG